MSRVTVLSAALLASLIAAPAAGQQEQESAYDQCLNKDGGDAAMLACAKTELARQESRLRTADSELAPTLSAEARPFYAAANETWRKFREAQCAWDKAAAPPGEGAAFAEIDCRIGMTQARANELEARAAPGDDAAPKR